MLKQYQKETYLKLRQPSKAISLRRLGHYRS